MKKLYILPVSILISFATGATVPEGYYETCEGLSGESLVAALCSKIAPHTNLSYNDLWKLYYTSDADEDGNLYDIYSTKRWTKGTEQCGTGSSCVGSCYTREHSFPKSWFGGAVFPMYTDAFHIYPADFYVNNQRNNNPYGECENGVTKPDCNGYSALGKLGACTFPGYTGKVFEPVDEYKGDLARGYFYMAACYYDQIATWNSPMLGGTQFPAFSEWALQLLLKWHRQDPVSQKELDRQEVVYQAQGNRNPFIDYPEMVENIWGALAGQPWSSTVSDLPIFNTPINGTVYNVGTVMVGETSTIEVPVNGSNLSDIVTVSIDNRPTSIESGEELTPNTPVKNRRYDFAWADPASLSPAVNMTSDSYSVDNKLFTNEAVRTRSLKGTSSNAPRLYTSKDITTLRLYPGNTTLVTSVSANIVKIEFGSAEPALYHAVTASEGTMSDDCKTWTGNALGVTFTWSGYAKTPTGEATNSPVQLSYMTVYLDDDAVYAIDVLTAETFNIPAAAKATYGDFEGTTTSGRSFKTYAYGKQKYIQIRNTSPSGIMTTSAGSGEMRAVRIKWNEATSTGRTVSVYGSETPYSSLTDLYSADTRGTLIGSAKYDGSDTQGFIYADGVNKYHYLGFHSNGAVYLDSIQIAWNELEDFQGYKSLTAWLDNKPTDDTPILADLTAVYQNGDYLYATDGRANICIYGNVGQTYQPGDIIPAGISGHYYDYKGTPELIPVADSFLPSTEQVPVAPCSKYHETWEITADMVNSFINFDEVALTAGSGNNFTAHDAAGVSINIYNRFLESTNIPIADDVEIEGFVSVYNGTIQVIPTSIVEVTTREFSSSVKTLPLEEVNGFETNMVEVYFTPQATGDFYATLTVRSGDAATTVYLTGTGVDRITALDATNVTPESFTANWVDIDGGKATYHLYLYREGALVEGYPVAVNSGLGSYEICDLPDNTDFTYCIWRGTQQSNSIEVTTLAEPAEIQVTVLESEGGSLTGEEEDAVMADLKLYSKPSNYSGTATISVLTTNLHGEMEISIAAPFEVSADKKTWTQKLSLDCSDDHFYLRLNAMPHNDGDKFTASLYVKAGRVDPRILFDNGEDEEQLTEPSWSIINDDIVAYGEVNNLTLVEIPDYTTAWEAYGRDGDIVIENNTATSLQAKIFTLEGYIVNNLDVKPGAMTVKASQGHYFIVAGDTTRRVIIK